MEHHSVTKPASRQDQKREAILNAARELFVELGPERVSMRQIAARLGQTTGALYAHFPDRESILIAVCQHDFLALRREFAKVESIADPIERLRELGRQYVRFALAYPSHYRLMFLTVQPPGVEKACDLLEPGNPDQDAYAFLLHTVEAARTARRFRPEFDDAHLVAQSLWAGVHGLVALQMTHADDPWVEWRSVEERTETMVTAMLRGLVNDGDPFVTSTSRGG